MHFLLWGKYNDFSSNDELEEARKKELQRLGEYQVYIHVPGQGQIKISTRWIYTYKNSNRKQTCKASFVARIINPHESCL